MLKTKTYKNAEFLEIKYYKIIMGLEVLLLITHPSEDPEGRPFTQETDQGKKQVYTKLVLQDRVLFTGL